MFTENPKNMFKNMCNFYIQCPHCDDVIEIEKVKCGVFLHAYNTKTGKTLNPHTKLYKVDKIRQSGYLIGCGGKFKLKTNKKDGITSTRLYS